MFLVDSCICTKVDFLVDDQVVYSPAVAISASVAVCLRQTLAPGVLTPGRSNSFSAAMALTNMKITKKQYDEAQAVVATFDEKRKRSLMATMVSFCKAHGDDEALKKKLQDRKQLAIKYFVYQQSKSNKGSTSVTLNQTFSKETKKQHTPMNKFAIEKKFGSETWKLWSESNKLGWEADPVTGSEKYEHRMWLVPRKMIEESEGQSGEKADRTESDAVDQETLRARWEGVTKAEEWIKDPNASSGSDGKTDGGPDIKQEPMTAKELQDQQITD